MSVKKRKKDLQELQSTDVAKKEVRFEFEVPCSTCGDIVHFHRGQTNKSCPTCGGNVVMKSA